MKMKKNIGIVKKIKLNLYFQKCRELDKLSLHMEAFPTDYNIKQKVKLIQDSYDIIDKIEILDVFSVDQINELRNEVKETKNKIGLVD